VYSKFFRQKREIDRLGEVAKPAVHTVKKLLSKQGKQFHLLQLHDVR